MKPQLPPTIEKYVRATNSHDAASFISLFDDNALVQDNGREFRGTAAIKAWGEREIFAVQVTLDVSDFTNRDGESVITAKVDGTFDRTGLPEPLFIAHYFSVKNDKIVRLRCQLANEKNN
jgi:hypothetical protein